MKVKRGLIKGGAKPAEGTAPEPVAAPAASITTTQDSGAPEGAAAPAAAARAASDSGAARAAAEAPPAEAVAAQPAGEQEPVEEQKEEASEADASTTEGQEETARAQAEAEEEITKKLIEVNAFMKEFFESFDENNDVVNENDFPEFNNIGKLSVEIINKSRQEEIKKIYINVLDNYKNFLTQILPQ